VAKRLQDRLLRDVFGLRTVSQDGKCGHIYASLVRPDQFVEGRRVAGERSRDKVRLVRRHTALVRDLLPPFPDRHLSSTPTFLPVRQGNSRNGRKERLGPAGWTDV
jgi:hypothetical protein